MFGIAGAVALIAVVGPLVLWLVSWAVWTIRFGLVLAAAGAFGVLLDVLHERLSASTAYIDDGGGLLELGRGPIALPAASIVEVVELPANVVPIERGRHGT